MQVEEHKSQPKHKSEPKHKSQPKLKRTRREALLDTVVEPPQKRLREEEPPAVQLPDLTLAKHLLANFN